MGSQTIYPVSAASVSNRAAQGHSFPLTPPSPHKGEREPIRRTAGVKESGCGFQGKAQKGPAMVTILPLYPEDSDLWPGDNVQIALKSQA